MAPTTQRPTPRPTPVPTPDAYKIDFSFAANVGPELQGTIRKAAARIESVIVGDLPDQTNVNLPDDLYPACSNDLPTTIDDMWLCASVDVLPEFVDGRGGYDRVRLDSFLPFAGFITISEAAPNPPLAVIIHEIMHAIGFGTIWNELGLTSEDDTCAYSSTSAAAAEYRSISGCAVANLPLNQSRSGGCSGHFMENCFIHELMTPTYFINSDGSVPYQFSRVSVAALQDLGYTVNFNAADEYTAANMDASCVCNKQQQQQSPKSKIPPLSDELREKAIKYGQEFLQDKHNRRQIRLQTMPSLKDEELARGEYYVGDRVLFLIVREKDYQHSLLVTQSYS
jgi:hypothetical protein